MPTSNPFAEFPTRPVSVDTLDGIEQVAMKVMELRDACVGLSNIALRVHN